jgi:nitrate/nitrite transporter NarK
MSPILKANLSTLILIAGAILLIWAIRKPNYIVLALSIILSVAGAFFAAVSWGQILKK